MDTERKAGTIALVLIALLTGIFMGGYLDRQALDASAQGLPDTGKASTSEQILLEAYRTIQKEYTDPAAATDEHLLEAAISGMVDSLGDTGHSRFLPEALQESLNSLYSGEQVGIGLEIYVKDGQVIVVAPIDGSPAQEAGLRPGDILLDIDGEDTAGMSLYEASKRLIGEAGTSLRLTVEREGQAEPFEVSLTRRQIDLNPVSWTFVPGTRLAHVRLAVFTLGSAGELSQAVRAAQLAGARGIILDMRNNTGGLVEQALQICSEFLASGKIVQEVSPSGDSFFWPVRPGGAATRIPLVVLINHGSASAAEIVAGALQDHERALLVGERTFGAGTILRKFPLSNGSSLLLSTKTWTTPRGNMIWRVGIPPDLEVALGEGDRLLLPEDERGMVPAEFAGTHDPQLMAAVEHLLGN